MVSDAALTGRAGQDGFHQVGCKGMITFDDYDGQALEIVRQMNTGLFMIRIDHLIYKHYFDFALSLNFRCMLISLEEYEQPYLPPSYAMADENSPSEGEHGGEHGYIAAKRKDKYLPAGKKFTPELLAADTHRNLRSSELRRFQSCAPNEQSVSILERQLKNLRHGMVT